MIRFDWFSLFNPLLHLSPPGWFSLRNKIYIQCKGKWTIIYVNVQCAFMHHTTAFQGSSLSLYYYVLCSYRTSIQDWETPVNLHSQWLIHYINRVLHISRYAVCFGAFIDGSNIYSQEIVKTTFFVLGKFLIMLPYLNPSKPMRVLRHLTWIHPII
jgi:hypothetical protein